MTSHLPTTFYQCGCVQMIAHSSPAASASPPSTDMIWLLALMLVLHQSRVPFACKLSCLWLAQGWAQELPWVEVGSPGELSHHYAPGDKMTLQHQAAAISHLLLSFSLVISFSLSFSLLLFRSSPPAAGTKKLFCLLQHRSARMKSLDLKTYSSFLHYL